MHEHIHQQKEEATLQKITLLIAFATVLQVAESLIPHPVPGVRLGLANMVTIIAIVDMGFKVSMEIAVVRTIVSSLILGSFMSPGFLLSFSGAIVSTLLMNVFFIMSMRGWGISFSLVGVSIIGAVSHNITQISLVYLLLINNHGIFMLLPWLGISAVITGWINGIIARNVCVKLDVYEQDKFIITEEDVIQGAAFSVKYVDAGSVIHRIPALLKIIVLVLLAFAIFIFRSFVLSGTIFIFLMMLIYISKIPFKAVFSGLKKLSPIIIFSFLLPLFFNENGQKLLEVGSYAVTKQGIQEGMLYASRIFLLMICTSILIRTTSIAELTGGIQKLLSPLDKLGFSSARFSSLITQSISATAYMWDSIRSILKNRKYSEKKIRTLIPALIDLIAHLYIHIDENVVREDVK